LRLQAALIERSFADRCPELVESGIRFRLAADPDRPNLRGSPAGRGSCPTTRGRNGPALGPLLAHFAIARSLRSARPTSKTSSPISGSLASFIDAPGWGH
jgi:hypothetical protein